MKILSPLLLASCCLAMSFPAQAFLQKTYNEKKENNFGLRVTEETGDVYISGALGINNVDNLDRSGGGVPDASVDVDRGGYAGIAVGMHNNDRLRMELEWAGRSADLNSVNESGTATSVSGEINTSTYMVNGYYDLTEFGKLTPYVTGGAGIAYHEFRESGISGDDTTWAVNLGLGADYEFGPKTTGFVDYRYLQTGDIGIGSDYEYSSQEVRAGVRYKFFKVNKY